MSVQEKNSAAESVRNLLHLLERITASAGVSVFLAVGEENGPRSIFGKGFLKDLFDRGQLKPSNTDDSLGQDGHTATFQGLGPTTQWPSAHPPPLPPFNPRVPPPVSHWWRYGRPLWQQYGPPPWRQYGPPPWQQYGPPPWQQYGPPLWRGPTSATHWRDASPRAPGCPSYRWRGAYPASASQAWGGPPGPATETNATQCQDAPPVAATRATQCQDAPPVTATGSTQCQYASPVTATESEKSASVSQQVSTGTQPGLNKKKKKIRRKLRPGRGGAATARGRVDDSRGGVVEARGGSGEFDRGEATVNSDARLADRASGNEEGADSDTGTDAYSLDSSSRLDCRYLPAFVSDLAVRNRLSSAYQNLCLKSVAKSEKRVFSLYFESQKMARRAFASTPSILRKLGPQYASLSVSYDWVMMDYDGLDSADEIEHATSKLSVLAWTDGLNGRHVLTDRMTGYGGLYSLKECRNLENTFIVTFCSTTNAETALRRYNQELPPRLWRSSHVVGYYEAPKSYMLWLGGLNDIVIKEDVKQFCLDRGFNLRHVEFDFRAREAVVTFGTVAGAESAEQSLREGCEALGYDGVELSVDFVEPDFVKSFFDRSLESFQSQRPKTLSFSRSSCGAASASADITITPDTLDDMPESSPALEPTTSPPPAKKAKLARKSKVSVWAANYLAKLAKTAARDQSHAVLTQEISSIRPSTQSSVVGLSKSELSPRRPAPPSPIRPKVGVETIQPGADRSTSVSDLPELEIKPEPKRQTVPRSGFEMPMPSFETTKGVDETFSELPGSIADLSGLPRIHAKIEHCFEIPKAQTRTNANSVMPSPVASRVKLEESRQSTLPPPVRPKVEVETIRTRADTSTSASDLLELEIKSEPRRPTERRPGDGMPMPSFERMKKIDVVFSKLHGSIVDLSRLSPIEFEIEPIFEIPKAQTRAAANSPTPSAVVSHFKSEESPRQSTPPAVVRPKVEVEAYQSKAGGSESVSGQLKVEPKPGYLREPHANFTAPFSDRGRSPSPPVDANAVNRQPFRPRPRSQSKSSKPSQAVRFSTGGQSYSEGTPTRCREASEGTPTGARMPVREPRPGAGMPLWELQPGAGMPMPMKEAHEMFSNIRGSITNFEQSFGVRKAQSGTNASSLTAEFTSASSHREMTRESPEQHRRSPVKAKVDVKLFRPE